MGLNLNDAELARLMGVIRAVQRPLPADWLVSRPSLSRGLQALIGADFIGTTQWNAKTRRIESPRCVGRDAEMAHEYAQEYQHCDPISPKLRRRRGPTLVRQVMDQSELRRTRYYNEFLRRHATTDGLDVYLYDGTTNVGDLRFWRAPSSQPFGERELVLVKIIEPLFARALGRHKHWSAGNLQLRFESLTVREAEIAEAVVSGQTDRMIAENLGISVWTVRTHLTHVFDKLGVSNRTSLAARINEP
ncbi:MAG: LuxR family transcriptional regulator [Betaproteobacteria bacterium HGW-Betaproteobacteria-14]|nr:MAG: LuxR family transcriptional regulator [Betaproteobacteria bacterium HGW-Betaproteobacteria-14]PKO94462.1 MAG: LuxR family transcriptional regulator [Betaproteobacteria bacterium HGW-Betaproteobacteria-10]